MTLTELGYSNLEESFEVENLTRVDYTPCNTTIGDAIGDELMRLHGEVDEATIVVGEAAVPVMTHREHQLLRAAAQLALVN